MNTAEIIASLEQERDRLSAAIQALSGVAKRRPGRRRLSAAARKKIGDAMRRTWAARKRKEKAA